MAHTHTHTQWGTCWSITGYGDDIQRLKDVANYPKFVDKVYGGVEACPSTQREHFQGCLITRSQRFSAIKKWLPNSHIEKAKKKEALVNYAMKQDTSLEDKEVRSSDSPWLSVDKLMLMLAAEQRAHQDSFFDCEEYFRWRNTYASENPKDGSMYLYLTRRLLLKDFKLVKYMDVKLRTLWDCYHTTASVVHSLNKIKNPTTADI